MRSHLAPAFVVLATCESLVHSSQLQSTRRFRKNLSSLSNKTAWDPRKRFICCDAQIGTNRTSRPPKIRVDLRNQSKVGVPKSSMRLRTQSNREEVLTDRYHRRANQ